MAAGRSMYAVAWPALLDESRPHPALGRRTVKVIDR
jgi:hypothetical protein